MVVRVNGLSAASSNDLGVEVMNGLSHEGSSRATKTTRFRDNDKVLRGCVGLIFQCQNQFSSCSPHTPTQLPHASVLLLTSTLAAYSLSLDVPIGK